jgi:hypothetical protein
MKHKLLYLLLILMVLGTSCLKKATVVPVAEPSGVFSGQFRLLERKSGASAIDTLEKATISISLNGGTKAYTVTGDTSVHAGSFGTYTISSPYILFTDKTYPTTGTPTKTHLNGTYQYYYDGTTFQMLAGNDTLNLQYDLKKTSN